MFSRALPGRDKVRGTVEVREHPFVRIEDERIDQLYSIDHPAHFREEEAVPA